jgi:hypothetical protein
LYGKGRRGVKGRKYEEIFNFLRFHLRPEKKEGKIEPGFQK